MSKSKILAGAGRAKIGIPDNFFPYHGFNGRVLTGVHDDLFVRAVLVANDNDKTLFISVDTGDLSDAWLPEISKLSQVPENNIFLTATHTHEAPYIDRTIPENVKDAEKTAPYIEMFRKALKEAILQATSGLAPALIGYGTGMCAANVNRDIRMPDGTYRTGVNPHGPTDHTVAVIKIERPDQTPVAYITNYAVHSSIMLFSQSFEGGMLMSGDLAGAAMSYVEKETGAVSLFTMGAAGDQNPLFSACKMIFKNGKRESIDAGEAGFVLVNSLGELLGNEIIYAAGSISQEDMQDEADIASCTLTVTAPGQKKPEGRPGTPLPADFQYEDGPDSDLRLGLIRINDLGFAGVPGEIMNSIGAQIRRTLTDKGLRNAVVMTQCNGSNSYMGDDEAYDLHKFAATASIMKKGIAGLLVNAFSDMRESLS